MTKSYLDPLMASIHETATGLARIGLIDKQTMRAFDAACLTEVAPLPATAIRDLRAREGVSQAVMARYLNVTTGLISQWERGEKKPSGPALKLLTLVAKNGLQSIA